MYILMVSSLSTKFIANSHQNLPVQPIFRDMLLKIAKSIEIVTILGKTAILP